MRQATVLEFAPDDAMEDLFVHKREYEPSVDASP